MKPPKPINLLFETHLAELGFKDVLVEEMFHPTRRFRLDYYFSRECFAVELNGGQYSTGHRSAFWGKKQGAQRKAAGKLETPTEDEYVKLNEAQIYGIRVFQFTNQQVERGDAKAFLGNWLCNGR